MSTGTDASKLRVQSAADVQEDLGPRLLDIDPSVSVLARDDSFSGRWIITGEGQVLGDFEGRIECAGDLLIGVGSQVNATIKGNDITISGAVHGNVTAFGRLKITSSGRLEGDATAAALIVQEGGVHHGTTRVFPEGVPDEQEPAPPVEVAGAPRGPVPTRVDRVRRFWGEFF